MIIYQALPSLRDFCDVWCLDDNESSWVDLHDVAMLKRCSRSLLATIMLPRRCVLDLRFVDPPLNEIVDYPPSPHISSHSLQILLPAFAGVRGQMSSEPK